jgi:hypothetical protein
MSTDQRRKDIVADISLVFELLVLGVGETVGVLIFWVQM